MTRKSATLLALACMLPVPSLGTYLGMVALAGTPAGKILFFAAKVWVAAIPVIWGCTAAPGALRSALSNWRGLAVGIGAGLGVSATIVLVYLGAGHRLLTPGHMRLMADYVGLGRPAVYLAGAAYWVLANAFLEELVYRWFLVQAVCELGFRRWAVPVSATAFVLHHSIAMSLYCPPAAAWLTSAGIFAGGLMWAAMVRRYNSIPSLTASHAIVDICVFALGYHILFGSG